MKFQLSDEKKKEIINSIETAEDKSQAIFDAINAVVSANDEALIKEIMASKPQKADKFSEEEKKFYGMVKMGPAKAAVTAEQVDIIPTSVIDRTLADIKAESGIFDLITFAPANVQKWLVGESTGAAVWGGLTDAIGGELTAKISALNLDLHKLSAYIVIPKAIRDLEIGYVDAYVRAKLAEVLRDGATAGYLNGDGKTGPVGIFNKIDAFKGDGTATAKTNVAVTKLSPKGLATVIKTLSHGGLRKVTNLALICNPLDEAEYVNPALYGDALGAGYVQKAALPINVIADANCTQGKAAFTLPGHYTMGFSDFKIDEYKETKALEDADVIIGKVYGNGRADDDDVAVVFDVTKLEEYKFPVENTPKTTA